MSARKLPAMLAAVTIALSGCGSDGGEGASPDPAATVTVEEAVSSPPEGRVTVRGFVLQQGGEVRMCAAVLESYPPQCGQPSFEVRGLDVAALDGATTEGDVTWLDGAEVTGSFDDGVLVVEG